MADDPLSELLVDSGELDRRAIADSLKGIVGIDSKTKSVVTLPGIDALNARQRIIAVLLGAKVAQLLEVTTEEGLTPSQVVAATGVPPGTTRPTLRDLLEARILAQDGKGAYLVSHHQVGAAIALLKADRGSGRRVRSAGGQRRRPKDADANEPSLVTKEKQKKKAAAKKKVGTTSTNTGVSAHVHALLESGFFDDPKTLSQVQDHLRKKRGVSVDLPHLSPVALRLLRRGLLDRDENDDGVYAYVKAG